MNQTELLIPSELIDSGLVKDRCIIPVVPVSKETLDPNTWALGTILMQKYYLVFDGTPVHDFGESYLRIGIGVEDHMKEDKIGEDYRE
jgi:hypothetical protein